MKYISHAKLYRNSYKYSMRFLKTIHIVFTQLINFITFANKKYIFFFIRIENKKNVRNILISVNLCAMTTRQVNVT